MDPSEDSKPVHDDLSHHSPSDGETLREIDTLLSSFRGWLLDAQRLASARATRGPGELEPWDCADRGDAGSVDLRTVLAELIAIKTEVQIQSKATKSARERLDLAADVFRQGLASHSQEMRQDIARLLAALHEVRESGVARAERGTLEAILAVRDAVAEGTRTTRGTRQSLRWRRLLLPRRLVSSLAKGYELSLRRIDRTLSELGVERLECRGRRFDPAIMNAVETVNTGDQDDRRQGLVVEEIRPGYTRNGDVVRCAEVKVCASHRSSDEDAS